MSPTAKVPIRYTYIWVTTALSSVFFLDRWSDISNLLHTKKSLGIETSLSAKMVQFQLVRTLYIDYSSLTLISVFLRFCLDICQILNVFFPISFKIAFFDN